SRDGGLVGGYVRRFGLDVVRGSSSRGGVTALRALVTAVRAGRDVALVPDGPRGPRGQLGPGVVALAGLTGAPVVPVGFAARPANRLATWDAFLVPAPFARAAVVFGAATTIARDADRERARAVCRARDPSLLPARPSVGHPARRGVHQPGVPDLHGDRALAEHLADSGRPRRAGDDRQRENLGSILWSLPARAALPGVRARRRPSLRHA